jgi:hypothetical protein
MSWVNLVIDHVSLASSDFPPRHLVCSAGSDAEERLAVVRMVGEAPRRPHDKGLRVQRDQRRRVPQQRLQARRRRAGALRLRVSESRALPHGKRVCTHVLRKTRVRRKWWSLNGTRYTATASPVGSVDPKVEVANSFFPQGEMGEEKHQVS